MKPRKQDIFELEPGEARLRFYETGLLQLGIRAAYGRILLTDKMIRYAPFKPPLWPAGLFPIPPRVDILLSQITTVHEGNWIGRLLNFGTRAFVVKTTEGRTYSFRARDATGWLTDIRRLLGERLH